MWVYPCFDGDNMELAWSQHDLYFGEDLGPDDGIGQFAHTTAGYFHYALCQRASCRKRAVPWFGRHAHPLNWITSYSHKLVQTPHEHIAAHYRWQHRHDALPLGSKASIRTTYLDEWRDYVTREIPALMRVDDIAVLFGRVLLYRNFAVSDVAADELDERLVEHYGFECVARTWRRKMPGMVAIARRQGFVVEDSDNEVKA